MGSPPAGTSASRASRAGGGSLTEAPTHTPRLTCLHARRGGAAATDPPHGRGRADPSNRRPRGPYPPPHTHTHSAGKNRRPRSPPHPPRAVPTCDGARDKAGGCEGAAGGTALPSRFAAATSTVARVRRGRVSRAWRGERFGGEGGRAGEPPPPLPPSPSDRQRPPHCPGAGPLVSPRPGARRCSYRLLPPRGRRCCCRRRRHRAGRAEGEAAPALPSALLPRLPLRPRRSERATGTPPGYPHFRRGWVRPRSPEGWPAAQPAPVPAYSNHLGFLIFNLAFPPPPPPTPPPLPQPLTPQRVGANTTAAARRQKLLLTHWFPRGTEGVRLKPWGDPRVGWAQGPPVSRWKGNPGWRCGHGGSGEHTGNARDSLISRAMPFLHIFSDTTYLQIQGGSYGSTGKSPKKRTAVCDGAGWISGSSLW